MAEQHILCYQFFTASIDFQEWQEENKPTIYEVIPLVKGDVVGCFVLFIPTVKEG